MNKDDYDTGLRQMFTGVGLAIFLGIVIGKLGIGIGALVFFIGLGKWYVARQAKENAPRDYQDYNNNFNTRNNEQETDTL
jgi:small neutral amino acid transporter SnatA (MarC family)